MSLTLWNLYEQHHPFNTTFTMPHFRTIDASGSLDVHNTQNGRHALRWNIEPEDYYSIDHCHHKQMQLQVLRTAKGSVTYANQWVSRPQKLLLPSFVSPIAAARRGPMTPHQWCAIGQFQLVWIHVPVRTHTIRPGTVLNFKYLRASGLRIYIRHITSSMFPSHIFHSHSLQHTNGDTHERTRAHIQHTHVPFTIWRKCGFMPSRAIYYRTNRSILMGPIRCEIIVVAMWFFCVRVYVCTCRTLLAR